VRRGNRMENKRELHTQGKSRAFCCSTTHPAARQLREGKEREEIGEEKTTVVAPGMLLPLLLCRFAAHASAPRPSDLCSIIPSCPRPPTYAAMPCRGLPASASTWAQCLLPLLASLPAGQAQRPSLRLTSTYSPFLCSSSPFLPLLFLSCPSSVQKSGLYCLF
jgi:hypothetical protein